MATEVNRAPKDADLWHSHNKMLAEPLKDNDIEVRYMGSSWVFLKILIQNSLAISTGVPDLEATADKVLNALPGQI